MNVLYIFLDFVLLSGTLSRGYAVSNSDRSLSSTSVRDYDGLKQQCDKAMHELQMLRRYVCQSSGQLCIQTNRICVHLAYYSRSSSAANFESC